MFIIHFHTKFHMPYSMVHQLPYSNRNQKNAIRHQPLNIFPPAVSRNNCSPCRNNETPTFDKAQIQRIKTMLQDRDKSSIICTYNIYFKRSFITVHLTKKYARQGRTNPGRQVARGH